MVSEFALRWDCADFLCTIKELLCFVQECGEKRDDVAWKQKAKLECETIDSKE
jgi:hypothetical protein